jgi:hypothetical protein
VTLPFPLPAWDPQDPTSLQFILDRLAQSVIDTGSQALRMRYGTVLVHWAASATSDAATVTHGLGTTPVAVAVTGKGTMADTTNSANSYWWGDETSTIFKVRGKTVGGAAIGPGDSTVTWIAIG